MVKAPPAWLLPDGLPPDVVDELMAEAVVVLSAVLWPCPMPAEPYPPPIDLAINVVALRLYAAGKAGEGQQVVSESIGSYTYRLTTPLTGDAAALVPPEVIRLIRPWMCQAEAFDVSIAGAPTPWPYDSFQRDLDNELAAADAAALEEVTNP